MDFFFFGLNKYLIVIGHVFFFEFEKIDIRFSSIRLTDRKKKLYCLPNRTDVEIEKSYCLPTTSSRCWVGGGSTVGGQIFHP
jgi:hypothetical protein